VTHGETFDAFCVFSNDGKKLAFLQIEINKVAEVPPCLLQNGKTKRIEILKYTQEVPTYLLQNGKTKRIEILKYTQEIPTYLLQNGKTKRIGVLK
jgi:hypothetical protein